MRAELAEPEDLDRSERQIRPGGSTGLQAGEKKQEQGALAPEPIWSGIHHESSVR